MEVVGVALIKDVENTGDGEEMVIVTMFKDVENTGDGGEVVIVTLLDDVENTGELRWWGGGDSYSVENVENT